MSAAMQKARTRYQVTYRGMDGTVRRSFSTLAGLQKYVEAHWQGADYLDGSTEWHNDYGRFSLAGTTLYELGSRAGAYPSDGYWDWHWYALGNQLPGEILTPAAAAQLAERHDDDDEMCSCPDCRLTHSNRRALAQAEQALQNDDIPF
jgi:hypothetical protein